MIYVDQDLDRDLCPTLVSKLPIYPNKNCSGWSENQLCEIKCRVLRPPMIEALHWRSHTTQLMMMMQAAMAAADISIRFTEWMEWMSHR